MYLYCQICIPWNIVCKVQAYKHNDRILQPKSLFHIGNSTHFHHFDLYIHSCRNLGYIPEKTEKKKKKRIISIGNIQYSKIRCIPDKWNILMIQRHNCIHSLYPLQFQLLNKMFLHKEFSIGPERKTNKVEQYQSNKVKFSYIKCCIGCRCRDTFMMRISIIVANSITPFHFDF